MPQDDPTLILIQRAKTGDREAVEELYVRYVPRVLAAVRCRLGPELRRKVESWDVLQEVMLESLKTVDDFDPRSEGAFLHWLSQVALNRIRDMNDFFRARKRDMQREQPPAAGSVAEKSPLHEVAVESLPTPSQVLMLAEDVAQLERALDQLSAEDRELIVSRKLEGRTFGEIAEELGVSADAVRMRTNRALARLVQAFEQEQHEQDE